MSDSNGLDLDTIVQKLDELAKAYIAYNALNQTIQHRDAADGRRTLYSADLSKLDREYHDKMLDVLRYARVLPEEKAQAKGIHVGDWMVKSPVGPGELTGFTGDVYPMINGITVMWAIRGDGAFCDPLGLIDVETKNRCVEQFKRAYADW